MYAKKLPWAVRRLMGYKPDPNIPVPAGKKHRPGQGRKAAVEGEPHTVLVQSRVSKSVSEKIEAAAAAEDVSMPQMIRNIIARYFESQE